jgi:hypothetical protein
LPLLRDLVAEVKPETRLSILAGRSRITGAFEELLLM